MKLGGAEIRRYLRSCVVRLNAVLRRAKTGARLLKYKEVTQGQTPYIWAEWRYSLEGSKRHSTRRNYEKNGPYTVKSTTQSPMKGADVKIVSRGRQVPK